MSEGHGRRRTTDEGSGVIVVHTGRQHSYETVLAVYEAGLLRMFATGFFVPAGSRVRRVLSAAGAALPRSRVLQGARHRTDDRIPSEKVAAFPQYHAVSRLFRGTPAGRAIELWADRRCDERVARWLRGLSPRPAAVHGFEGACVATFRAARACGIRTVLDIPSAHELVQRVRADEGMRPIEPKVTERVREERELADVLLVPSQHVGELLVERGVESSRIVCIPYGVDAMRFAPSADRRDDVFRVLFVGNGGPAKGLGYLLEAWRRFDHEDAELVLVGDLAAIGELPPRIKLTGPVPRFEVHHWFARSDVFVLPSLAEGSALVTYEAMAAEVPVIATRAAGSAVRDGLDGFIVPERDAGVIARKLDELYRDRDLARKMGASGRDLIRSSYSWDHYRRRIAELYDHVLSA